MSDSDAAGSAKPQRTPLFELHQDYDAKLVEFAGYSLPLSYPDGIIGEHRYTREKAGLFDVSHMGQVRLGGEEAAASLERLLPSNVIGLRENRQRYALMTNDRGGIMDDFMITNAGDHLYLVVNATRKTEDVEYLKSRLKGDCVVDVITDRALIAIQGPAAAATMARLAPDAAGLVFMSAARLDLMGLDCLVSRSGYTGEDGFEISVPADAAYDLARALLESGEVRPAGLGARDSLRLEAGLCLYGQDLDESTTPVEAGLEWALSKARRREGARAGGYPGYEVIARQLEAGPERIRVGIRPEGRAPVRGGTELVDNDGHKVGKITSGGYGATVGGPVAMGYIETTASAVNTRLSAMARGKARPVRITRLPFVEPRYYRG